jgi:hypothetical protein
VSDDQYVKTWLKDFDVVPGDEVVTLRWKWQDESKFDTTSTSDFEPEEAIELAYRLIRAANQSTTGRLKDA